MRFSRQQIDPKDPQIAALASGVGMGLEQLMIEMVTSLRSLRIEVEQLRIEIRTLRPRQMVTIKEAAREWGVSENTVRRQITAGRVQGVERIGRAIRIDLAANERRTRPSAPSSSLHA